MTLSEQAAIRKYSRTESFEESSLKAGVRRSKRRTQIIAIALVGPLLAFNLIIFVAPLVNMLKWSVWNAEFSSALPHLEHAMDAWKSRGGHGLPPDDVFAALAQDLKASYGTPALATATRRLSYDIDDARTLIGQTSRKLQEAQFAPSEWKSALDGIDHRWSLPETWEALDRVRKPFTDFFLLWSVDLMPGAGGKVVSRPIKQSIYQDVLIRTFVVSITVTALCLLLGFPVAYWLANQPHGRANAWIALVLLPFWTPLLVRTAAWVVILQENGLANGLLRLLGLIDHPLRLLYGRFAVVVAMVHVLLPFMILPLYSVMKNVPRTLIRAGLSLGASPQAVFTKVYLPLVRAGVAAGSLLVFILALGYYITPALVGGAGDQMISYFIAFNTTETANWSLAAALASVLLIATLALVVFSAFLRALGRIGT